MTPPGGQHGPLPPGPRLTVDVIIVLEDAPGSVVLIRRRNPPPGWALPGGFVDMGETVETAAIREAREETGLEVDLVRQFHVYSDPARDRRMHTVSIVFIGKARGQPMGADDAAEAVVFPVSKLPEPIAFDHSAILQDYIDRRY